jgi:short-subunit dehydrogenase
MIDREPKLAVITGASAGLGTEFARQLAAAGYHLLITARRKDRLEALSEELCRRYGVQVEVFAADLADPIDLHRLEDALEQRECIDLLINNAGFGLLDNFWELGRDAQETMLRVHILASTRLSHAVLPGMLAHRKGGLVQVASVAAFLPGRHSVIYNASKAYLVAFCQSLQTELKGSGVHVQALCPGFTLTEFHDTPQLAGFNRRDFPSLLWLKASDVVSHSLRAVDRGSGVVVPGFGYRLIVFLMYSTYLGSIVRKVITG